MPNFWFFKTMLPRKPHGGIVAMILLLVIGLVLWKALWAERVIQPGTVISGTGSYSVPLASVKLRVWTEGGILMYEVRDNIGKLLIRSKERASTYSQWYLLWDEKNSLWVLSSDIGNSVWQSAANGAYAETFLFGDKAWYAQMPHALLKHVPRPVLEHVMRSPTGTSGSQAIVVNVPLGF